MRFKMSLATEIGNASSVGPSTLRDGAVTLRPSRPADVPALLAGRDEQRRQFLGTGDQNPHPTFCVLAADEIAGWVDYDHDAEHDWLGRDEVNVGYELFPAFRARGLATRSVQLLLHHLALIASPSMAGGAPHPSSSTPRICRHSPSRSEPISCRLGTSEASTTSVVASRP